MNKEKYIETMVIAIEDCKGKTEYTEKQIELMKKNGIKVFVRLFELQGSTYFLQEDKEEPKEVEIKFEGFKMGHNDFQILCNDMFVKKCMKEIFGKMKEEGEIGSHGCNGYGDALVISYEPWGVELN